MAGAKPSGAIIRSANWAGIPRLTMSLEVLRISRSPAAPRPGSGMVSSSSAGNEPHGGNGRGDSGEQQAANTIHGDRRRQPAHHDGSRKPDQKDKEQGVSDQHCGVHAGWPLFMQFFTISEIYI